MWLSRSSFDALVTRAHEAEVAFFTLQSHTAVQQQNFDWLANHVNRLEAERATLLHRVLGVAMTAPMILRGDPETPAEKPGMGEPLRTSDRPTDEEPGMAVTAMQAGSFEDMGDQAATRFGVVHESMTGSVMYTR